MLPRFDIKIIHLRQNNNKFYSRIVLGFILILLFTFNSCGNKLSKGVDILKTRRAFSESLQTVENKCSASELTNEETLLFKEILTLEERIQILSLVHTDKVLQKMKLAENSFDYFNFKKPLVSSFYLAVEEVKNLKKSIDEDFQTNDDFEKIFEKMRDIQRIKNGFLRFTSNKCRLEDLKKQSKFDPTPFLAIYDFCHQSIEQGRFKECLKNLKNAMDQKFQSSAFLNQEQNSFLTKKRYTNFLGMIQNLCLLIYSQGYCNIQTAKSENEIFNFVTFLYNQYYYFVYRNYYLTNPLQVQNKFFCQKSTNSRKNQQVTIEIPTEFVGFSPLGIENLNEILDEFWNNQAIKFKLVPKLNFELNQKNPQLLSKLQSYTKLKIIWNDQSLSYVRKEYDNLKNFHLKNDLIEMYLSKNLNFMNFKLIFAHEFGHVLGLKDCYVEFVNDNGELVYFELPSKNNLMCSLRFQNSILLLNKIDFVHNACSFKKN